MIMPTVTRMKHPIAVQGTYAAQLFFRNSFKASIVHVPIDGLLPECFTNVEEIAL